jgi:hypothetical protein
VDEGNSFLGNQNMKIINPFLSFLLLLSVLSLSGCAPLPNVSEKIQGAVLPFILALAIRNQEGGEGSCSYSSDSCGLV